VPGDVPALEALERDCFSHPWSAAQIEQEVAGVAEGLVLVLEGCPAAGGGGRLRAYCAIRRVLDELHVMNLAVSPGDRRRGLARWLLGFAIARACREGATRALLEVRAGNREAVALYESMGFRRLGARRAYYREPVEDALVLVREGLGALGASARARGE
jgi:ribosomal-protein-alanine N-acetyltransferase